MAQSLTAKLAERLDARGTASVKLQDPTDTAEVKRAREALRRAAIKVGAGDTYVTEKKGSKVVAFI